MIQYRIFHGPFPFRFPVKLETPLPSHSHHADFFCERRALSGAEFRIASDAVDTIDNSLTPHYVDLRDDPMKKAKDQAGVAQ